MSHAKASSSLTVQLKEVKDFAFCPNFPFAQSNEVATSFHSLPPLCPVLFDFKNLRLDGIFCNKANNRCRSLLANPNYTEKRTNKVVGANLPHNPTYCLLLQCDIWGGLQKLHDVTAGQCESGRAALCIRQGDKNATSNWTIFYCLRCCSPIVVLLCGEIDVLNTILSQRVTNE
ncbi:hypothetical protein M427DRAFT_130987 [Gonapodya prolifera JEL478]|uniref:Uncharacterized protein n=1 Tax=Gonapodya prolifera (strain JEL478) TaxID=1344416 RepID=A0A139AVN7_GONPJ|nr:hypothetical protein M427DRAFT_130987 [Gonapodya prolifera JEL478]|eukprot:KXS20777.1 hypothetical protein M427DRAFT_130987 [Gonapodya prolifera JEL478]